jgi:methylmalonyl-CoA mutase N-terminal domain/subunit
VVGVNRYTDGNQAATPRAPDADPGLAAERAGRLAAWRAARDQAAVDAALAAVGATARGTANLLGPMADALRLGATLGEVSDALRRVLGTY